MKAMLKLGRNACLLWLALSATPCRAGGEVYTHVDRVSGMVVLSNVPPPASMAPAHVVQDKARAAPAAFTRVTPARQREMDADRRAILEDELNEERRALAAASGARAAREVLTRHAANIAALQRELARVAGTRIE